MKSHILYLSLLLTTLQHTVFAAGQFTDSSIHSNKKENDMEHKQVFFRSIKVDGLAIFYREAGTPGKPVILLLHGFPSSSRMYNDLMRDLADSYHLIAPDYPGFGQSSAPVTTAYTYTFDNLTTTISHFIDQLGLKKFSLYLQDYGGPIGFRIATQRPEAVQALIIQNANAYTEGLGEALAPLAAYMQDPNADTEKGARALLTPEATRWQYTHGAENIAAINPDSYITDQYYLDRPGNDVIQLALFRNYSSNLALYDTWQAYFSKYHPATLVISGRHDPLFVAAGALAFKKDNPAAEIHLLNGGHFALEEHHLQAAALIKTFLQQKQIH